MASEQKKQPGAINIKIDGLDLGSPPRMQTKIEKGYSFWKFDNKKIRESGFLIAKIGCLMIKLNVEQ